MEAFQFEHLLPYLHVYSAITGNGFSLGKLVYSTSGSVRDI